MSEAVKKSEEMRQSAIALLLSEREEINDQLQKLGWDGNAEPTKRRGRPPKLKEPDDSVTQPSE